VKYKSPAGVMVLLFLGLFFVSLCPSQIAFARTQSDGPDVPSEAEQGLFVKGQTLYNQGLFSEAIVVFSESLKSYPNSVIKDLNLLWLGRSYLRAGDIASAEKISLRLREISDTSFAGLYEDELRIARQSYVRSAAPAFVRRDVRRDNVVAVDPKTIDSASVSPVAITSQASVAPSVSAPTPSKSPATRPASVSASTPIKSLILPSPAPAVAAGNSLVSASQRTVPLSTKQGDGVRVLPPAKIRLASEKVLTRPQKETSKIGVGPVPANAPAPLLRIRIEEMPRNPAGGGVIFYRLVVVNEGHAVAKDLVIREELDASLDFASSDPAPAHQEIVARSLVLTFRLQSIEPGGTRSIRIAVRPRPDAKANNLAMNVSAQTKHSINYQDSKGTAYRTP
jgi:hypothetical protein